MADQETNLVEIDRANGPKVESSYLVGLKDDVDMSAFMRRFGEACPPGPGTEVTNNWLYIKGFCGTFGDETLHFLQSCPEVDTISENVIGSVGSF
ncbi:hypothetical protein DFP72DRAFT_1063812 [Ephemerocybe angulata]|uniref:Uncharacterized protein n=1 Tax=Ephemerocybe angulata TaxID=980116 RepID=A0A8H6MB35_9AGAR|nr:hypothetical protein DFP72DRAFT_1063812 [Tulosesus angulatus]